jgi:hypothetical protein
MQTQQKKTDERTQGADNQHSQLVVAHEVVAPSSPVRTRIWKNLANIKFKALKQARRNTTFMVND